MWVVNRPGNVDSEDWQYRLMYMNIDIKLRNEVDMGWSKELIECQTYTIGKLC